MSTWRVDDAAQRAFADLSGDHNPLHLDPIVARRTPFGRVAVHGVHLLADALERLAAETPLAPRRVRATFLHSVGVGDEIATSTEVVEGREARLGVTVDVWTAADIRVELGDAPPGSDRVAALPDAAGAEAHDLDSLRGATGTVPVAMDAAAATERFPGLAARVGRGTLAELLTLTRLVGMHVPGLHSLLSAIDVSIVDAPPDAAPALEYTVTTADERFSRIVIEVRGPTVNGRVTAFVRPGPVEPTTGGVVAAPNEFTGQRWLVVGGSRGLGAIAVQLLDRGGADVRFTFLHGRDDARRLADRCRGGAAAHRLDVLEPEDGLATLTGDGWQPTHLAYFATPPIFQGARGAYSDALRATFDRYYVDAFLDLVARLDADRLAGIVWPSSEAAAGEVAGLAEYADAKRAGEAACDRLASAHPRLRVSAPRLPRLPTDQTTSFVPVEFGDAATEVLAALRGAAG